MGAFTGHILGFDTSARRCEVALLRGGDVLAHVSEEMDRGQAERLMVLCEEVLARSHVPLQAIGAIGVGVGPGNFTGIRISVAAARGLALGLGIPAIGVTGFEALRHGQRRACACLIDGRQNEVFVQTFDAEGVAGNPMSMTRDDAAALDTAVIGTGHEAPRYPAAIAICHVAQTRLHTP